MEQIVRGQIFVKTPTSMTINLDSKTSDSLDKKCAVAFKKAIATASADAKERQKQSRGTEKTSESRNRRALEQKLG